MNQRDAIHYIETRQEFTASALRGSRYSLGSGRLAGQDLERLHADVNGATYFVYSYETPIAWHTPEGWYVVSQKFSTTTSKHTNYVRRAVYPSVLVGA